MTPPRRFPRPLRSVAAAAALLSCATAAAARPATCRTSDEGEYPCTFTAMGRQGSFRISAAGKPTVTLEVDRPGVAFGYLTLGGRTVPLPGEYARSTEDPACWINTATSAKVCAR
ncbi:hypothetical protein [Methylobacterium sp. WSM2598]|uniref:hypothetical protein n=1 Tax=Methylobacterium sp. WSM2598 TaxID=398261 RepID=UPI000368F87F|nr:hypothetical protein [Methylobacterium sp. WSM2598]